MQSIDLTKFDGAFQRERTKEPAEFGNIADGKYHVIVARVELTNSAAGHPMLKWTLHILGPQFVDRLLWHNSVITENSLRFLKTELALCGLAIEKLSDLPQHLDKLLDIQLEVAKKTKGDKENIYFNRRIDATISSDGDDNAGDLVPF